MAESPVWADKVERVDGKAVKVVMTDGLVFITFVKGSNGRAVELPGSRTRMDRCPDLWMPPVYYKKAREMAASILSGKRRTQKGSKKQ